MDVTGGNVLAWLGALAALGGLLYTARQLRMAHRIARSEFLLHFYEMIQPYNDVHARLSPGGDWADGRGGPVTPEEWFRVNRYMGLLEIMQVNIEEGLLDAKTMDRLYSHRVIALAQNPVIRQTNLVERAYRWSDFLRLQNSLSSHPCYRALMDHEFKPKPAPASPGG
ncbi:MAG TPA: hypothetical protein VGB92_09255 [Longimicrobium sp.]|jgi:hypothetical protein